jgi:hypothetical protein
MPHDAIEIRKRCVELAIAAGHKDVITSAESFEKYVWGPFKPDAPVELTISGAINLIGAKLSALSGGENPPKNISAVHAVFNRLVADMFQHIPEEELVK